LIDTAIIGGFFLPETNSCLNFFTDRFLALSKSHYRTKEQKKFGHDQK